MRNWVRLFVSAMLACLSPTGRDATIGGAVEAREGVGLREDGGMWFNYRYGRTL